MAEHADHTNSEQEHPAHAPEAELIDRALQRIKQALGNIAELEARMARNIRRH